MWVLLFYLSGSNGIAVTTVYGFTSEAKCHQAEVLLQKEFDATNKTVKTLCIKKD